MKLLFFVFLSYSMARINFKLIETKTYVCQQCCITEIDNLFEFDLILRFGQGVLNFEQNLKTLIIHQRNIS